MDTWLIPGLRLEKYKRNLEHLVYQKVRKCSINKRMGDVKRSPEPIERAISMAKVEPIWATK